MSSCSLLLLLLKLHSVWTSSNTSYMSETRNLGTLIERWWRSRGRCLIKINVRRSKFIGVKQPELKYCDIFMAGKNVEYDFVNSLIASVALCIKLWDGRACSKEVTLFKEGGIFAEFAFRVHWSLSLIDHYCITYNWDDGWEVRREEWDVSYLDLLPSLRCYGMSGVCRLCQSWHCCYANLGVGGGRWWSHQKVEARQQRKILGLKYVQNVDCPLPAPTPGSISTTPWAGLVIYQPYPGQPTP